MGGEQQVLERFRDDYDVGLKAGSLEDFEKLSSKNKVLVARSGPFITMTTLMQWTR